MEVAVGVEEAAGGPRPLQWPGGRGGRVEAAAAAGAIGRVDPRVRAVPARGGRHAAGSRRGRGGGGVRGISHSDEEAQVHEQLLHHRRPGALGAPSVRGGLTSAQYAIARARTLRIS